jgi:hypothetical protein
MQLDILGQEIIAGIPELFGMGILSPSAVVAKGAAIAARRKRPPA